MPDFQLQISPDEKAVLVGILETALKGDLVEEHRSDNRAYRKQVENEIALIKSLLAKVKS
ncbi:MAG: hypothetical protein ACT4QC_23625 [Planctomycetaceae bacterium]